MKQLSWLVQRKQHANININSITSHHIITSHHLAPPAWRGWPYSCTFPYSWLTGNSKLIGSPIVIYLLPLALDPYGLPFILSLEGLTLLSVLFDLLRREYSLYAGALSIQRKTESRWKLAWSWSFLLKKPQCSFEGTWLEEYTILWGSMKHLFSEVFMHREGNVNIQEYCKAATCSLFKLLARDWPDIPLYLKTHCILPPQVSFCYEVSKIPVI